MKQAPDRPDELGEAILVVCFSLAAQSLVVVLTAFASTDSEATPAETAWFFWRIFSLYLAGLVGLALHWKRRGKVGRAAGLTARLGVNLMVGLILTFRIQLL